MDYSLFRSRTFYTLVLMFAFDAVSVYGNLLSPNTFALVNLILTSVASYFHLQTGKSQAGAN